MPNYQFAHTASAAVLVPHGYAISKLGDPDFIGRWALGSMGLEPVSGNLFRGISLFDGAETYVEIRPSPELGLIDFAVGDARTRNPRIFIRVTSGADLDRDDGTCLVTLHALRSAGASDENWSRTCTTHETEILLIKAQLETACARETS